MADDQLYQALGRIEGKVEGLTDVVKNHLDLYEVRHKELWISVDEIKADINQAKGAKGAVLAIAGMVSAGIYGLMHHLEKLLK